MKLKHISLLTLFVISFGSATIAHEGAKGPHGGQLVGMSSYHAEFEVKKDTLNVYVIGEKEETMSAKDLTGSVIIQFPDGKKTQEKLMAMGDALMVSAPVAEDRAFIAIATLKVKGKSYSARYSHHVKGEKDEHQSHAK
jgi:hypothetical protein